MDYQFPQELFPSLITSGPPDAVLQHFGGKWGSYERVRPQQGVSGPFPSYTFTSKHHIRGEKWRLIEPVPVPFLSPKMAFQWPITPPDPLDFTDHLNNYYLDHSQDAFGCMTDILGGNFNFHQKRPEKYGEPSVNMWKVKKFLNVLKYQTCPLTYYSNTLASYSQLLSDVVPSISPELLGSHLYEELAEQRDRLLFCEASTGGALAFIPFSQSSCSQQGCLLYPSSLGLQLNFHKVELQHQDESSSVLNQSNEKPFKIQLKSSARQLSFSSLFNDCCVGVRSDYFCGVWRFNELKEPRLLQVVNTTDVASCISVSPHILGEVLVASESGVADLWTVGKGMQRIRMEDSNLYFNAKSSWRWCEFTAHPRVMLYADRTGADLTDIRVNPTSNHMLFKISSSAECRSGERLILCKYLENAHPFHHLITTQYSAYIMDERFPSVPMLKLDHMMDAPPMYCHIVPSTVNGTAGVSKVLLGSHRSQEITMLQYAGGQAETCFSLGPPRALLRPKDSLHHLPAQIPHRMDTASKRLSSPATGLTLMQTPSGKTGKGCICVLQLTEAGDIFYQVLEPEHQEVDTSPLSAAEDILQTEASQMPENDQSQHMHADNSSEESEAEVKLEMLRDLQLQIVMVNEPTPELQDEHGVEDEMPPPQQSTPLKVSNGALVIWKHWLQKLFRTSRQNKPHSHMSQHFTVNTESLLSWYESKSRGPSQKVETLRQSLRTCMSQKSLLLHSTVSDLLQIPHVPVPNPVDTKAYTDSLSQRLTHAWQGLEAWQAWWDDHRGLNREAKLKALRRKRRQEKAARRAAGQQYVLSGSFSSSASCVSDTDDFSFSQVSWFDIEVQGSHLNLSPTTMDQNPEAATPLSIPFDVPCSTPPTTPQSVREQQTVERDRTHSLITKPESTAIPQKIDSPAVILHSTQEESSQSNRPSTMHHSSQTSIAKRSHGQRSSSQASQPKKKSRMGF